MSSIPMLRRKVSTTCSLSPRRIKPVSTYTHVNCDPMARCTRAAATEESTPPLSPQMARSPPTWERTAATWSSTIDDIVQFGRQPAMSTRNLRNNACPPTECTTSGWCCTPKIFRSMFSITAIGASGVAAVATNPAGSLRTASKWLIHTSLDSPIASGNKLLTAVRVSVARPYSPRPPRSTPPPSCWATS